MNDPVQHVTRLIEGYRATALISTAVRLGILDHLDEVPRAVLDLATALQLSPGPLHRTLRGLALLELVNEEPDPSSSGSRFSITAAGRLLKADARSHLHAYALLTQSQYAPAWLHLESALRTGDVPFDAAFGASVWEYRRAHPAADQLFNRWLQNLTATVAEQMVPALGLLPGQVVADVAGGTGVFISQVLAHYPQCQGLLVEQPSVLAQAREFLVHTGVLDRCRLVAGDILETVPGGCDVYLLKSVLHDWQDADCLRILSVLQRAMAPTSRLLLIERLVPARALDDPNAIWIDLAMLAVTGGRERSRREFQELLADSALTLKHSVALASGFHLIEAARA